MLREVYGPELMLEPHVMPVSVLDTTDPAGDTVQLFTPKRTGDCAC